MSTQSHRLHTDPINKNPDETNNAVLYHMVRRIGEQLSTTIHKNRTSLHNVYEDDKVEILTEIGGTLTKVRLKMEGGLQDVYFAQDATKDNPHRLNPGRWTTYLKTLDKKARDLEEKQKARQNQDRAQQDPERYAQVDDRTLFP